MNGLTATILTDMLQALESRDPLLQRGIDKDWVCVIHPQTAQALTRNSVEPTGTGQLSQMTGRETYIIDDAPQTAVEFMPRLTMYIRYARWFAAEAELAAQRKAESETT